MVHSWHLFLILNCIICYFLYLSFSSLYSSLHTIIWAKLNKPGVSIKPLPKMLVGLHKNNMHACNRARS